MAIDLLLVFSRQVLFLEDDKYTIVQEIIKHRLLDDVAERKRFKGISKSKSLLHVISQEDRDLDTWIADHIEKGFTL